jgi:SAM-dependent methyltransferase
MLGVMRHVLKDESMPLFDQKERRDLVAIGVSDSETYAKHLASKFSYTNTYSHTAPHLDLCDPESVGRYSNIDLIVCSDVIEHTFDKPRKVVRSIFRMLKPGGVAILSAPTYYLSETIEWYPHAKTVEVKEHLGKYEVHWTDIAGIARTNINPCFHGGPGSTLEMRLIAHQDLVQAGSDEGFHLETLEFSPEWGYSWPIVPQYPGIDAPMDGRVLILNKPSKAA